MTLEPGRRSFARLRDAVSVRCVIVDDSTLVLSAASELLEGEGIAVVGVATNGTAANGLSLAANAGWTFGNGSGTVASTATAANYLCIFQSGTAQLAGNITYVQQ